MYIKPEENTFEQSEKLLLALLKEIAKDKGLSIQDLSERTGFQPTNMSKILNGGYSPTLKVFLKIAHAVEVNFFLEDKESKTNLNVMMEKAMDSLGRRKPKNRDN